MGTHSIVMQSWKEFDDLPEADKKLVQKQIEHQLKDIAEQTLKKQGNIPGELADTHREAYTH